MPKDLVARMGATVSGEPDNGKHSHLVTLSAVALVAGIAYATDPFRKGVRLPWKRRQGGMNELLDRVGSSNFTPNGQGSLPDAVLAAMRAVYAEQYPGWKVNSYMTEAVMAGHRDPGQWAPDAPVVVHRETGWPPDTDVAFWTAVDERLASQGVDLYHEPLNAAVIGFYST